MLHSPDQSRLLRLIAPPALGVGALVCLLAGLVASGAAASGNAAPAAASCPSWVTPPRAASAPSKQPASPTKAGTRSPLAALPAVAYEPKGIAVGPTRASVGARVASGTATALVVQYGPTSNYRACSAVVRPRAATAGDTPDVLLTRLRPNATYHFRLVARTASGPVFAHDRTFRTLPGGHVPQGVKVGTVAIGGLSRNQARAALVRPLAAPLRLSYAGAFWHVSRLKAGALVDAKHALTAALTASPGQALPPLKVSVDQVRLRSYVASLDRRWSRKGQKPAVRLVGKHAVVAASLRPLVVDTKKMTALIGKELAGGGKGVLPLAVTSPARATVTPVQEKAVVVRLGAQTLTAYLNGKPVLETPITTGRPALPTPIGSYFIHFRASPYTFISPWPPGSPYYYPPAPVTWAMYFFDNDFLHDDPAEPSSAFGSGSNFGGYASHGCVHVPHDAMAFLYDWLPVGAPVIVSQT